MPLDDELMIAVKNGVVELTATVIDPHADDPQGFLETINRVLYDHQYQAMTDPTLLDPYDIEVATVVESRDPLPDALRDGLISLGFQPLESEHGGRDQRSMFSRFQKKQRTKLDRWKTPYLRAADVSPRLAALEESLIEDTPEGDLPEVFEEASEALINGARTYMRLLLTPGLDALTQLERHIMQERGQARGRLVLHPAAVRALAGFTAQTVMAEAPATRWSDDPEDESPLWVESPGGGIVRSDPEFRVVKFVIRGNKELLSTYVESVLSQSTHEIR